MNKLAITRRHFENIDLAKSWKRAISKEIHPDKCKHPKASDAMAKLNSMYNDMVRNE